ncbi:hypothetical protein GY45DRAFT_1376208 [Cubamyces sp. BRFM 1775]|nr:hypothetical protein GY45DRAFT_1376208 [Cubamyces sp. BRFM 1775]
MSTPTYLTLIDEIVQEGNDYGPRYREHIRKAIKHETHARRIVVTEVDGLDEVRFTPRGITFYQEWRTIPLYPRDHPRVKALPIRALNKHSRELRRIIDDIKSTFLEFHPHGNVRFDKDLPDQVVELFETVSNLQERNSELLLELNMAEQRKREASRALRAMPIQEDVSEQDADGMEAEVAEEIIWCIDEDDEGMEEDDDTDEYIEVRGFEREDAAEDTEDEDVDSREDGIGHWYDDDMDLEDVVEYEDDEDDEDDKDGEDDEDDDMYLDDDGLGST